MITTRTAMALNITILQWWWHSFYEHVSNDNKTTVTFIISSSLAFARHARLWVGQRISSKPIADHWVCLGPWKRRPPQTWGPTKEHPLRVSVVCCGLLWSAVVLWPNFSREPTTFVQGYVFGLAQPERKPMREHQQFVKRAKRQVPLGLFLGGVWYLEHLVYLSKIEQNSNTTGIISLWFLQTPTPENHRCSSFWGHDLTGWRSWSCYVQMLKLLWSMDSAEQATWMNEGFGSPLRTGCTTVEYNSPTKLQEFQLPILSPKRTLSRTLNSWNLDTLKDWNVAVGKSHSSIYFIVIFAFHFHVYIFVYIYIYLPPFKIVK